MVEKESQTMEEEDDVIENCNSVNEVCFDKDKVDKNKRYHD